MIVDKIYKQRFNDTGMRSQLWEILTRDFFQQFIKKTDTVLDVPCGYAEFINTVRCKKKYAMDINPDAKQYINKDVKFLLNSSTKMSLKDGSVNKIFISNFFEHLTHDDIEKTVIECRRVLKKGGQVLILQPNIRFASKNYWMFFDHITPIDDRALEEIFVLHDFTLQKRVLKFVPFTTQSRYPVKPILIKIYLKLPFMWRFFGQQTFLIFEK